MKSEKYETLHCLQAFNLVPKMVRRRPAWQLACRSSSVAKGIKMVVLFWTKYAISLPIELGILKLTIRRDQRNFSKVFIFVSCDENGYYRVIIVLLWGQFSFDCRWDCKQLPYAKVYKRFLGFTCHYREQMSEQTMSGDKFSKLRVCGEIFEG